MNTSFLDTIDPQRMGAKLQQARKSKGMTQADAAQVIDVSRTTMTAIENGERCIKPEELIKLAQVYGVAVNHFVRQTPEITPFDVQFRATLRRSSEQEATIENIIREWEQSCQDYLGLEDKVGSPLVRNYPAEYQVEGLNVETAGESLALQERARLGLGDGPIPLLRDVLEQEVGLRIFFLNMPAQFSEMFNYDERLGGCLALNINHPEERRRWSLAHGYLHFLAHRKKPIFHYDDQYIRKPESEQLADAFPKYFLMPTAGLVKRFGAQKKTKGKFTPADLCTLAHYYGVSVEAMAHRLEELKLLPSGTWDHLKERGFKVRDAQRKLGLSELPQRTDRNPLHYQHLAIEALDQGLITEGRFAKLLHVDRLEARSIAFELREHSSGMEKASELDLTHQGTQ